jgi:PAS domain-containing protein
MSATANASSAVGPPAHSGAYSRGHAVSSSHRRVARHRPIERHTAGRPRLDEVVAHNPARISSVILDITDAKQVAALDDSLGERLDAVVDNACAGKFVWEAARCNGFRLPTGKRTLEACLTAGSESPGPDIPPCLGSESA